MLYKHGSIDIRFTLHSTLHLVNSKAFSKELEPKAPCQDHPDIAGSKIIENQDIPTNIIVCALLS